MMKSQFRPKSIRNLSGFMGEITAYIAGVEVALLEAQQNISKNEKEKWSKIAEKHAIHLGGVSPSSLLSSHSRMSILSIYSAFDSYLGALRKEYALFYGKWVQHDGDAPFDAIMRNCPNKSAIQSKDIESYLIAIDHYRIIRNIVAHPRDEDKEKSDNYFENNAGHLNLIRKEMSTNSAPNRFDHLQFEDIKVFARMVLHAADIINNAFTPTNDIVAQKIPPKFQFKKLAHDIERRRKSIVAYLRMEYGLKQVDAESIADKLLAH